MGCSSTPSYDGGTAGTYVFTGTLSDLPDHVTNSDDAVKSTINVIVAAAPVSTPTPPPVRFFGGSSGGGGGGSTSGSGISSFILLMANWGQTGMGNQADFNGNGVVDIQDFI